MNASRGRARFGVLVPFTNTNLEPDMGLLRPKGVSLHFARMGGYDADEIPDSTQMQGLGEADLSEPLRLLAGVKPDVVFYGCTSATLTHGVAFDRDLAARIQDLSGAKTVTAAGALVHALTSLEVKKIGFASPYVSRINDMAASFLSTKGFETVQRAGVPDELDNDEQGRLTPAEVFNLGLKADHENADAIVLSCTDMRSIEAIKDLEQRVGKPVISSNQAMMRQALDLMGFPDGIAGFGGLLDARGLTDVADDHEKDLRHG